MFTNLAYLTLWLDVYFVFDSHTFYITANNINLQFSVRQVKHFLIFNLQIIYRSILTCSVYKRLPLSKNLSI